MLNKHRRQKIWFAVVVLALLSLTTRGQALDPRYTVTNTGDSGNGSLRWAIQSANDDPGADTIDFQVPVTDPGYADGVWTIRLTSQLPLVTDAATVISGTSQAVYQGDTNPGGPEIQLLWTGTVTASGLILESSENVVHGLAVNGFVGAGVGISGTQATSNVVTGNWFGLSPVGTKVVSNDYAGVAVYHASHNTIGGTAPGERNIFGSGDGVGVSIQGSDAAHNRVVGNHIGISGTVAIGGWAGVDLRHGAHHNTIGGAAGGEGNVIAGNVVGVVITGTGANLNTVRGNIIGLDPSGVTPVGNANYGVRISGGASNNIVLGNTIAGNDGHGVVIWDSGSTGNKLLGNYIGTDAAGTPGLGNRAYGVVVDAGVQESWIGADMPGLGNVIAGNGEGGVLITGTGTISTTVWGNFVGVDSTAKQVIPNQGHGICVTGGAQRTWIGGSNPWTRNVIGANLGYGVRISGMDTASNTVTANFVGITGTMAIGNRDGGIYIGEGAHHNTVGGDGNGERNVISGNVGDGVHISNAHHNTVSGNIVGLDPTGDVEVGDQTGVVITEGAQWNRIGGETAGQRNLISGNQFGVMVEGSGTDRNTISGNYIGLDATGTQGRGHGCGVYVGHGAQYNVIGGALPGERNVVADALVGVQLAYTGTMYNVVQGNYIGVDATGTAPLKNYMYDVNITDCAQNNTVGPDNVIAYGDLGGVRLQDGCTQGNTVTRNAIYGHTRPGIELIEGANRSVFSPLLHRASCRTLTVESWPGWIVEVFADADDEGRIYLTSALVPSDTAYATITLATTPPLPNFTATGTDPSGNTSAFSVPLLTGCRQLLLPLVMKAHLTP